MINLTLKNFPKDSLVVNTEEGINIIDVGFGRLTDINPQNAMGAATAIVETCEKVSEVLRGVWERTYHGEYPFPEYIPTLELLGYCTETLAENDSYRVGKEITDHFVKCLNGLSPVVAQFKTMDLQGTVRFLK